MLFLFRIGSRPVFMYILFLWVLSFSSCSDSSEKELFMLTGIEESLTNSTKTINKSTESLHEILKQKLTDPTTAYRAQRWQPKALEIKKLTTELYHYLENIKVELKKEAGIISESDDTRFNEGRNYTVKQQFITEEKGKEIFVKMSTYKKDLLEIDSGSKELFKDFLLVATRMDSLDFTKQNMNWVFFENASVIASLVALSQFENNVKNIENRMVQFCLYKIPSGCGFFYDSYSAIVVQNSNNIGQGQEMEISAGIGAFSKAARPRIAFDDKIIPIDESGVAVYKFKAPAKSGNYRVPVKIAFIDQDGKERILLKTVKYTVTVKENKISDN